jgi:hypothetical protein
MYYSSMGPGAPGNFEGMQRATLGADMVGLNINTGGQDQNGNPQLAFDPYGSNMDEQLRRNFQPMRPPSAGPQLFPIRRVEGPGMQVAQGLPTDPYPARASGFNNKFVS